MAVCGTRSQTGGIREAVGGHSWSVFKRILPSAASLGRALEFLRVLWDHTDTGMALLLAGAGSERALRRVPALASRVLIWELVPRLRPAEVAAAMAVFPSVVGGRERVRCRVGGQACGPRQFPDVGEAHLAVEDGWAAAVNSTSPAVYHLVPTLGDRGSDAPAPQKVSDCPAGIRLIADHSHRCRAGPAGGGARDVNPVEYLAERGGVVGVAGREHDGQRQAPTIDGEVDLGGQPASGPAEGLARLRADRIFQFVPVACPFLRAPAACWWARLTVESTATVHSTRPTESSRT